MIRRGLGSGGRGGLVDSEFFSEEKKNLGCYEDKIMGRALLDEDYLNSIITVFLCFSKPMPPFDKHKSTPPSRF